MNILDKIQVKIGNFLLKEKLAESRTKEFNNFQTATSIGIIFNAAEESSYRKSKAFISEIGKNSARIYALGYVPNNEIINLFPYHKDIHYFALNNSNWYKKPTDEIVTTFCKQEFDILINLSLEEKAQIQYIVSMSKAKFKIGKACKASLYDFLICLNGDSSLENYIMQIKHYMTIIKKPVNSVIYQN